MGVVCTSSRILRWIFSATFSSYLEKESAAVLTDPAICAIKVELQRIITFVPQGWWNGFCLEELVD